MVNEQGNHTKDTRSKATQDVEELAQLEKESHGKNYGGIHRTGYFFGMLGFSVIRGFFDAVAQAQDEPGIGYIGLIITFVACFILVVNRLHNIGMSGLWSLLILVPFVNLYIVALLSH